MIWKVDCFGTELHFENMVDWVDWINLRERKKKRGSRNERKNDFLEGNNEEHKFPKGVMSPKND